MALWKWRFSQRSIASLHGIALIIDSSATIDNCGTDLPSRCVRTPVTSGLNLMTRSPYIPQISRWGLLHVRLTYAEEVPVRVQA